MNEKQEYSVICIPMGYVRRSEPWNSNQQCRRGEVECMMGMKDEWMERMKEAML